ncbi:MAG: flagellar hook-associated protein FlgK, partial [Lachnospiraceae bacterium]|nr:flagellar hook-associated protein FlgK [Lachnospiraceae bacterium]
MPSTFFGLDIGYTGLSIYQNALNTTAHNITNAETEGYSRQYLGRKAGKAISISSSYGMVGTGVIGTGVDQKRDTYYDVKYRDANTLYGEYSGKSYYMNEIEDYFNEEDGEGFSTNF